MQASAATDSAASPPAASAAAGPPAGTVPAAAAAASRPGSVAVATPVVLSAAAGGPAARAVAVGCLGEGSTVAAPAVPAAAAAPEAAAKGRSGSATGNRHIPTTLTPPVSLQEAGAATAAGFQPQDVSHLRAFFTFLKTAAAAFEPAPAVGQSHQAAHAALDSTLNAPPSSSPSSPSEVSRMCAFFTSLTQSSVAVSKANGSRQAVTTGTATAQEAAAAEAGAVACSNVKSEDASGMQSVLYSMFKHHEELLCALLVAHTTALTASPDAMRGSRQAPASPLVSATAAPPAGGPSAGAGAELPVPPATLVHKMMRLNALLHLVRDRDVDLSCHGLALNPERLAGGGIVGVSEASGSRPIPRGLPPLNLLDRNHPVWGKLYSAVHSQRLAEGSPLRKRPFSALADEEQPVDACMGLPRLGLSEDQRAATKTGVTEEFEAPLQQPPAPKEHGAKGRSAGWRELSLASCCADTPGGFSGSGRAPGGLLDCSKVPGGVTGGLEELGGQSGTSGEALSNTAFTPESPSPASSLASCHLTDTSEQVSEPGASGRSTGPAPQTLALPRGSQVPALQTPLLPGSQWTPAAEPWVSGAQPVGTLLPPGRQSTSETGMRPFGGGGTFSCGTGDPPAIAPYRRPAPGALLGPFPPASFFTQQSKGDGPSVPSARQSLSPPSYAVLQPLSRHQGGGLPTASLRQSSAALSQLSLAGSIKPGMLPVFAPGPAEASFFWPSVSGSSAFPSAPLSHRLDSPLDHAAAGTSARALSVQRYLDKRRRGAFRSHVKYVNRRTSAAKRVRISGRFVSGTERLDGEPPASACRAVRAPKAIKEEGKQRMHLRQQMQLQQKQLQLQEQQQQNSVHIPEHEQQEQQQGQQQRRDAEPQQHQQQQWRDAEQQQQQRTEQQQELQLQQQQPEQHRQQQELPQQQPHSQELPQQHRHRPNVTARCNSVSSSGAPAASASRGRVGPSAARGPNPSSHPKNSPALPPPHMQLASQDHLSGFFPSLQQQQQLWAGGQAPLPWQPLLHHLPPISAAATTVRVPSEQLPGCQWGPQQLQAPAAARPELHAQPADHLLSLLFLQPGWVPPPGFPQFMFPPGMLPPGMMRPAVPNECVANTEPGLRILPNPNPGMCSLLPEEVELNEAAVAARMHAHTLPRAAENGSGCGAYAAPASQVSGLQIAPLSLGFPG